MPKGGDINGIFQKESLNFLPKRVVIIVDSLPVIKVMVMEGKQMVHIFIQVLIVLIVI